jgi:alpha-acetolactate decarboxylase
MMRKLRLSSAVLALAISASAAVPTSEVRVIGQMRRMFVAHDIAPNVDLRNIVREPHVYALGPLAPLKGEVTVVDSQTFVSEPGERQAIVSLDPAARAIFLVYAVVPTWRSISVPTNVGSERDLATFIDRSLFAKARSAFLVRGTALSAQYHIQNYRGRAEDLTHEAHDEAKVLYELSNTPVQLVGFFSNREEDGGSFVHQGQTTHIHIISDDRKSMGHLESITLASGATLLLPQADRS